MRKVLVGLVLLAVLIVAADRGALWLAERVAADRARAQGLTGADVDVRGVPFLTQLADRDLREVVVTGAAYRTELGQPGIEGAPVGSIEVTGVRVVARDVAIDSRRDLTAARITVDGVVAWADVAAAAGSDTDVTAAPNGEVNVQRTVRLFGRSTQVRALARVTAVGGSVVVRPTEASIEGAGRLGELATEAVLPLMTLRYPVVGLPDGLVLTGAAPAADGLAVTLSGRAVSLRSLGEGRA